MRRRSPLFLRIGYEGRSRQIRLGGKAQAVAAAVLALVFVMATQFVYEYRENRGKARKVDSLQRHISEQNLSLYNLRAKFDSLETEVERLRTLDARVKTLLNLGESRRARSGAVDPGAGVGGAEMAGIAGGRLDRFLDLKLGQLTQDVLVEVKDLEVVCEKLDIRRVFLECTPAFWPVRGVLTSAFGARISPFTETKVFHRGLDISAPLSTPVAAAAGGRVVRSGFDPLLGHFVVLEHGSGFSTIYGHLSERLASEGDVVQQGDVIGRVGSTGRSTGPHLHYEVHVNGLPVNPVRFLN